MSYDIRIINKHTMKVVDITDSIYDKIGIDGFEDYGGTYQIGEKTELSTNMTYNYYPFLRKVFGEDGIRSIYGLKFSESEKMLSDAIKTLENADTTKNEWIYRYVKHTEEEKENFYRSTGLRLEEPTGYWRCTVENVLKALKHLKFLVDTAKKLNPSGYDDDFEITGD